MLYKISRYKFKHGKIRGIKIISPLTLEELKPKAEVSFPNGKLLLKKPDYALFRVTRKEPVVARLLKLTDNKKDKSSAFIIMYSRNIIAGYKSKNQTRFLPYFTNKAYKDILEQYIPKKKLV